MKNSYKIAFLMILATCFIYLGCSDWTKTESIGFNEENLNIKPIEQQDTTGSNPGIDTAYYKALREWKATPNLPQTYLWYDSWIGVSPTGKNSVRGLPDSVTIIANWGAHPKWALTDVLKADMKYVQEIKGTKVVVTLFSQNVGDDVPEAQPDSVNRYNPKYDKTYFSTAPASEKEEIIRQYAKDVYKMCIDQGYDGYDQDLEGSGNMTGATEHNIFLDELSYWFGPKAMDETRLRNGRPLPERRLLLIMDHPDLTDCPAKFSPYIDYFVLQTYACSNPPCPENCSVGSVSLYNNYINSCMNQRDQYVPRSELVHRIICTENFEGCARNGGGVLNMSNIIYNLDGLNTQAGGFGIYRVGFDYDDEAGDWKFLKQGIANMYRIYRQLNP
jgi:hypothetical protein